MITMSWAKLALASFIVSLSFNGICQDGKLQEEKELEVINFKSIKEVLQKDGLSEAAHKKAREVFQNLSANDQKEYVEWIEGAKRKDTRSRRLEATVEKLLAGKRSPMEK